MRFETVKKQIEETPQIDKLEAFWFKNPREKIKEAMINRTPKSVMPDMSKDGKVEIHTHPDYTKPSLPSFQDLYGFNKRETRLMVVAAMNSKGEVVGYTFINKHLEKKSVEKPLDNIEFENKKLRYDRIKQQIMEIRKRITELKTQTQTKMIQGQISNLHKQWQNFGDELTNMIYEQLKLTNWKMRLVPMKGYQFKHGYFIPKAPPPSLEAGGVAITNQPQVDLDKNKKKKQDELDRVRRLNQQQRLKN